MTDEHNFLNAVARQTMVHLTDRLIFPRLVHRDCSDEPHEVGDTVRIRKPAAFVAAKFDAKRAAEEETVDVTLDHWASVEICKAGDDRRGFNPSRIVPAAEALAEKVNSDGLSLYKEVYNAAYVWMACPARNNARIVMWAPDAARKALSCADAARDGRVGHSFGMDHYMNRAVCRHRTGIIAAKNVKVSGAVREGADLLNLCGSCLRGRLTAGDLMRIDGRYYTAVEESAEAVCNVIAGVRVAPALPALPDGTDVTLVGDHTANMAFYPSAFAYVTRPPKPSDGASCVASCNGISLRVTKRGGYSVDVLYGYKVIRPEMAARVLS